MSGDIVISASMRSNLLSLQRTQGLMDKTQDRLATGYKVGSALDNPSSYFSARQLRDRAGDLNGRLDSMGQGIQTLKAADKGIQALTKLIEQAKGLTAQGLGTSDTTTRATLATQFDALRTQIDELVTDTGYGGKNLLNGDSLTVKFNEDGSSKLAITGVTYDSAGLGVAAAANSWAADADIDAAVSTLDAALTTLRGQASTFGANLSVVTTREEFTKDIVNLSREGADKLTLADMNEEGANLLALQTRQQLGVNSLSMASQAAQSVLRLF